jgi:cellobiose-specific phosphotransferase system component IIA
VALLIDEAQNSANNNDYVHANKKLEQAQHMITAAIQKMLNSQTIVYDLNFETPQEEYEYELKRFGGYEELIPVAVEQKNPNEGTKKLMTSFVEKGQKMRNIAEETAKAGDYPRAIAMMQDATKEIRRALRMVGVMQ